ncbi:MAG: FAD-dependent oxidoreductase, partial [Gammaproteobacteria bacterium]|nr:FAD-dependent oxidoreductase [Gammaproteobacteria bacterium]
MSASIFTDDFKPQPYWWDYTPQPASISQVLPEKVDVLVVGSGYTG